MAGTVLTRSTGGITGTSGVWTNVTPAGIDLTAGYSQTVTSNTDDNYGVQDIVADPVTASTLYAFVCYQGCWKSTDYGATWTKVSGSSVLDTGKNWGSSIAPDASYLLNTCGNSFSGSPEGRRTIQRSTDSGATWTKSADLGADPYNVTICPFDATRAIACMHDTNHFYESIDSGVTWVDKGVINAAIVNSAYGHYLHNADTVLVSGNAGEHVYRGTKSGSTWTFAQITDLNGAEHEHGIQQIFYDVTNTAFFYPGGESVTPGIFKSTNNGTNWTRVYSTSAEGAIIGSASTLYAMRSFPINTGSLDMKYTTAARNPGTSWAAPSAPSGMINGAKRFAVVTDGARTAIVAGCWCGGIWRYIE